MEELMKQTRFLLGSIVLIALLLGIGACASAPVEQSAEVQEDILVYLTTKEGRMPPMMSIEKVVDMAIDSHEEWNGSTTHFRWGDLSGIPLYVVSLYPDLGIIKEGKEITREELIQFAEKNYELFEDPRVCIGTWFNEDDGNTYIDINVVMADKAEAVELGKKYNQISIFNLETFEETSTGGDGTPMENLPEPVERLPEFK